MTTLNAREYKEQHEVLKLIINSLKEIGFSDIECPAYRIEDVDHFEGKTKAIQENFRKLKQVDCFVMVYNKCSPSSVLVELGYAIALSKKIIVFYKSKLPFLVEKAGDDIAHVRIHKYKNYEDIVVEIKANKMALFRKEEDE